MTEPLKHPNSNFTQEQGVSLKEHIETILKGCQKSCESKFESRDKEVSNAYHSMERRLDSMNEFRDTLKDQASRFVTRAELLAVVGASSAIIIALVAYLKR